MSYKQLLILSVKFYRKKLKLEARSLGLAKVF